MDFLPGQRVQHRQEGRSGIVLTWVQGWYFVRWEDGTEDRCRPNELELT